jgi:hypothetical protein
MLLLHNESDLRPAIPELFMRLVLVSGGAALELIPIQPRRHCRHAITIPTTQTGNTLSDPSGKSYTWDFENRLTQAVVPGTGTTTFHYDPFGWRIQKSGSLGTTNYLYEGTDAGISGANVIAEVDNSDNVLARYTSTQSLGIEQPLGRFLSGDRIGNDEGSNLYTYVRNAPIQFRDPTGLHTLHGFGPQREQQMRDAIQSAIDTLEKRNKDCKDGCAGSLGRLIRLHSQMTKECQKTWR